MNNAVINNFKKRLLSDFPVFIQKMEPDDLQPYMLFGDFGIYIRDLLESGVFKQSEVDAIFMFLNEMGESSDEQVHNLLTVGVLEIITDSSTAATLTRKYLKGQALKDFNMISEFWSE